jgi:hypothetical protein
MLLTGHVDELAVTTLELSAAVERTLEVAHVTEQHLGKAPQAHGLKPLPFFAPLPAGVWRAAHGASGRVRWKRGDATPRWGPTK